MPKKLRYARFDGESDHGHLLINYPPKVSISKLVNSLKGVSSRRVCAQQFKSALTQGYYPLIATQI
ncbi:hypothetical protein NHP200010_15490 [Helicobacter bizzozeronii]|nr:hypothetical protein NHP200010_15490 [Helicobacter bizzozeronii]